MPWREPLSRRHQLVFAFIRFSCRRFAVCDLSQGQRGSLGEGRGVVRTQDRLRVHSSRSSSVAVARKRVSPSGGVSVKGKRPLEGASLVMQMFSRRILDVSLVSCSIEPFSFREGHVKSRIVLLWRFGRSRVRKSPPHPSTSCSPSAHSQMRGRGSLPGWFRSSLAIFMVQHE